MNNSQNEEISVPRTEFLERYADGYREGLEEGYRKGAENALQMAYTAFLRGYKDLYPATGKRKLERLFWAANDALKGINQGGIQRAREVWRGMRLDDAVFDALGGNNAEEQGVFRGDTGGPGGDRAAYQAEGEIP
jgi:hypothetical protein